MFENFVVMIVKGVIVLQALALSQLGKYDG